MIPCNALQAPGITLQGHNHLKGTPERLIPNRARAGSSNYYSSLSYKHLRARDSRLHLSRVTTAVRSQTAGTCGGSHCFLGDTFKSADDTQTAGSLYGGLQDLQRLHFHSACCVKYTLV